MKSSSIHPQPYKLTSQVGQRINAQVSNLASHLGQICQLIVYNLLNGDEPQVQQFRDRAGNIWWEVRDPMSGRSLICSTEQEVLVWLEQLHNH